MEELEGYKKTELGWIPEDWEVVKVSDAATIQGGFAFPSNKFVDEGKFQVIKMSNLYGGTLDLKRSPSFINEVSPKEELFKINQNDILITLTGTVGKEDFGYTVLIKEEQNLFLNQRVARIIASPELSDPIFLNAFISSKEFRTQFFLTARGGTGNQANVGVRDLAEILIPLPPLPEQKQIAQVLSTWDETIEKTEKLIATKEQFKQGLMQELLTGKTRFPEFADEPWQEVKLGDIGTVSIPKNETV